MKINNKDEYLKYKKAVEQYERETRKSYNNINKKAKELLKGDDKKVLITSISGMNNYLNGEENLFFINDGKVKHINSLTSEDFAYIKYINKQKFLEEEDY